jgi:hypothetical protein
MIYRTLHRKLPIEQHEPSKNRGWTEVHMNGKSFLLHPSCYSCYKPGDKLLIVKDRIVITKNANVVDLFLAKLRCF